MLPKRPPKFVVTNHDGSSPFDPELYYSHRKKRQTKALERMAERQGVEELHPEIVKKYRGQDEEHYRASIRDTEVVEKMNRSLAIIVPTHSGHLPWLRSCLTSIKDLGYYILLCYDNSFLKYKDLNRMWPQPDVLQLTDGLVSKHFTWQPSVGASHFWNMLYGLNLLKGFGFTYVFNINGDCVLEKPENFPQLIELLGDNDLYCNHTQLDKNYMGTMGWIGKIDVMERFFMSYAEKQYMGLGTTEGRLALFVKEHGIKVTQNGGNPVKYRYKLPEEDCTWYKLLGFRHLHAEHKVRRSQRLEPYEQHYYDIGPGGAYVGRHFMATLQKYYETGDRKYLEAWWDR